MSVERNIEYAELNIWHRTELTVCLKDILQELRSTFEDLTLDFVKWHVEESEDKPMVKTLVLELRDSSTINGDCIIYSQEYTISDHEGSADFRNLLRDCLKTLLIIAYREIIKGYAIKNKTRK